MTVLEAGPLVAEDRQPGISPKDGRRRPISTSVCICSIRIPAVRALRRQRLESRCGVSLRLIRKRPGSGVHVAPK